MCFMVLGVFENHAGGGWDCETVLRSSVLNEVCLLKASFRFWGSFVSFSFIDCGAETHLPVSRRLWASCFDGWCFMVLGCMRIWGRAVGM